MTTITKALVIVCGMFAVTCVALLFVVGSKNNRIQALEHAAELSKVRIESMEQVQRIQDALLAQRATEREALQADIDSLSKLIRPHGKPRPRPVTVPAIRDSILSATRTR